MKFASNHRRNAAGLAAILSTAALYWFGNGLNPWWPLMWFAPIPVLLFSIRSSWRGAALVSALSIFTGGLNLWQYIHGTLHGPAGAWVITFSVIALIFTAAVLIFRGLVLRGALWSALLAFPGTWVSCEYAANLVTPNGTAGSLSYSQLKFLPFLQLASVTGPWGMSFLLLLFPAAVAIGVHLRRHATKQALRVTGAALGVIAAVLVFGAVRLATPVTNESVKVGLIASDLPANDDMADAGADTARLFRDYAREAEKLAAVGARAIVMPEKLGVVGPDIRATDDAFQSLADRTGATIVAGMVHISPSLQFNQARVYAPGVPVRSYDKQHMLPPFELKFKPGTTLTLMPGHSGIWGAAICKDMDFTPLSRDYGKAGVGLMLVPAWDFRIDRLWHGHIAIMRGVESGFSIARAAKDGFLTVSDDRGRVLAETRSDSAAFATLLADVPVSHDNTLYLLLGDWFAWVVLGIFAFVLAQLFRVRKCAQPMAWKSEAAENRN